MNTTNTKVHTSRERKFLNESIALWPVAKGSLAEIHKPCIRSACLACSSGKKHRAFILSVKFRGRLRCLYVPLGLVSVLRQAITNGRRLEQMMSGTGIDLVRDYRIQHGGRQKRSTKA